MNKAKLDSEFSFSKSLKELEQITSALEMGEVDVDKALEMFERGQKIAKDLEEYLKKAENTIRTIKSKN